MARNNLEERLTNFAVVVLEIVELLPNTAAGKQIGGQLIRSGTSPALNYGEAKVLNQEETLYIKWVFA